jgi:hypothetical protein
MNSYQPVSWPVQTLRAPIASGDTYFHFYLTTKITTRFLLAGELLHDSFLLSSGTDFAQNSNKTPILALSQSVCISHKVFPKFFCKSQFPLKSVILFLILVTKKDKLTDLWGI